MPEMSIALPSAEVARLGKDVFNCVVLPPMRAGDHGKVVIVDVLSENFEIDADDYTASKRRLDRHADGGRAPFDHRCPGRRDQHRPGAVILPLPAPRPFPYHICGRDSASALSPDGSSRTRVGCYG